MEIKEIKHEGVCVIQITGRLDAATAPDLEKKLQDLLQAGENNFLIDLTDLNYISSVGLRVLLVLAKKTKASAGQAVLCGLQEHVYEVFEISGFTSIFQIFKTREEGLSIF